MRSLASAFASAAVMVGVSACGGQVLEEPIPPPPVWEHAPPTSPRPPTSDLPIGTTEAPSAPTSGPLAANTCLAFQSGNGESLDLVGIDLATGKVTPQVKVQAVMSGPPPSSLAVVGDEVLFCDQSSSSYRIARVSRLDGATTFINRACTAIAADANGIYMMQAIGEIVAYPDVASLASDTNGKSVGKLHASVLGTSRQGILAAWHASDEVLRLDGALALDGYNDWIFGLSGAPGNRVIVSSPRADGDRPGLIAFDATTGKKLGTVATPASPLSLSFAGLACGE